MYHYFKRFFDVLFAILVISFLGWLFCLLAVIVFLITKQNPIFIQLRVGKNEQPFRVYKFRTILEFSSSKTLSFLRKTSLDELPQLFNVVKGEMSLVGPRPLLLDYLPLYTPFQKQRHNVLPGITGLTQISGGNGLAWEHRFILDVEYIRTLSFINDFKILLKTIFYLKFFKSKTEASSKNFTGN